MFQGCLGRIVTWIVIIAVGLWVLRYPESLAGLFGVGLDLASGGGDSFGRFMTAMVAELDGLI
ncbi:hypothetical protein ACIRPH_31450 [Nocardiopsis sp. NPDC101807]|uniref:hypothetical protein n=1 Tax=Nocardiopsis sp. NPDC101807 TaxID=3364339 RepID=UPI0037F7EE77